MIFATCGVVFILFNWKYVMLCEVGKLQVFWQKLTNCICSRNTQIRPHHQQMCGKFANLGWLGWRPGPGILNQNGEKQLPHYDVTPRKPQTQNESFFYLN